MPVSADSIANADLVVLIGCEVPDVPTDTPIVRWDGVPAVSDGYEDARAAIVQRLSQLLDRRDLTRHPKGLVSPEATSETE